MSSQILTLDHFRDIDVSFRGRIRFIYPDFLAPVDDQDRRPHNLLADTPLPKTPEEHNPRHLPPLVNEAIQQEMENRIYRAMNELDSAKPERNGISLQMPQRTIQTSILLRQITLDIPKHGPITFHEVWNGYNQTIAIKKVANKTAKQYETLGFIVEFMEGLPDDNEGPNLQKVGRLFQAYSRANNIL